MHNTIPVCLIKKNHYSYSKYELKRILKIICSYFNRSVSQKKWKSFSCICYPENDIEIKNEWYFITTKKMNKCNCEKMNFQRLEGTNQTSKRKRPVI